MTLTPGMRLGPHEIISLIGAGGMGEVYQARDTRLDRMVAIKVLPAHLADNPELCERFEREARTIAGLNHPHICTLHDIGRQDGIDFLVMEYVEGETLATRLLKGPLPIEHVLRYAIEIADALDKAHRKGVTHRDIKPGNIMLTKSGTKLLDFGLAKLKQQVSPATSLSQLPTMSHNPTVQGTLLGTMQYMAPEQLEGKVDEIDGRTDIFAFGAVVYEMATGKKAFQGKSQASLISAIMSSEPAPISTLQPMTPPALDRVIKRCLAKDPDERWQSARDLEEQLRWIAESAAPAGVSAPAAIQPAPTSAKRPIFLWSVASFIAAAIITGLAIWSLRPASAPRPVTRTVINLPPGDQLARLDLPAVAFSPDGNQLAYVATRGNVQQIYVRPMDSFEARPITGTENAVNPFFSSDGQWLGFYTGGNLKKILVSGGAALTLGVAGAPRGASWGSQRTIVFAPTTAGALQQVSDAGGAPQPLARLQNGESIQRWPEFLPGGQSVLFAAGTSANSLQIALYSPASGERRILVPSGTHPHYAPSGHLIYAQQGTLMAVPFDAERLQLRGTPVPVVEGVLQSTANGFAQYAISVDGSLAYIPGGIQATQRTMVWVDRRGAEQPLPAQARAYRYPRLSPDGQRVASTIEESESNIWLYDLRRDSLTRLTFEGGTNLIGAWAPDGKRMAFGSTKGGPQNLYWQPSDGSGGMERLTTSEYTHTPNSWSPDGQLLAFVEIAPDTGYDIWVLRLSDHKAQPFLRTRFTEGGPSFSPDGRWLVYSSDESGRQEIYVQPYPGPGGKWQISTDGGTEPLWNRNGREIFYRNGNRMMAVDVATQPAFSAGKPRLLFERPYLPTPGSFPNYDVSADGQRFLMLKAGEQAQAASQINVVLNWTEELKRRVPTGR